MSARGLHLHFEPTSGIAGDMAVAALVDAGVPATVVKGAIEAMGVRGLRVADASVIPSVPVSAMNAPSMMIGWRAAELLRAAERPLGRDVAEVRASTLGAVDV